MQLMEELPKDKAARGTVEKSPSDSSSAFNLFSSTADSKMPKESSSSSTSSSSWFSTSQSQSSPSTVSGSSAPTDWKNILIIILLILVIFSYFGVQLLNLFGDHLEKLMDYLRPTFGSFLDLLGYSAGTVVNKTADITAGAAKAGIDVAEGTVQNIGNIMIGDEAIGKGPKKRSLNEPEADVPEDTIQKSLSSSKTKWCLVGEYQNKRGCIDISESDKCMSGQVFPTKQMCTGEK